MKRSGSKRLKNLRIRIRNTGTGTVTRQDENTINEVRLQEETVLRNPSIENQKLR
jgi:hypothetical protein